MNCINSFDGKYRFLSNFYEKEFEYLGIKFPTSEHAFAFRKIDPKHEDAGIHGDRIISAKSPGEAKRLGRKVPLNPQWEDMKVKVMLEILMEKFKDEELQDRLLQTKSIELIEGNTWGDRIWGMTKNNAGEWEGRNLLGCCLMIVRSHYRNIFDLNWYYNSAYFYDDIGDRFNGKI